MSMNNTLTPDEIEPATFRFVAQRINHCATAVPSTRSTQVGKHPYKFNLYTRI